MLSCKRIQQRKENAGLKDGYKNTSTVLSRIKEEPQSVTVVKKLFRIHDSDLNIRRYINSEVLSHKENYVDEFLRVLDMTFKLFPVREGNVLAAITYIKDILESSEVRDAYESHNLDEIYEPNSDAFIAKFCHNKDSLVQKEFRVLQTRNKTAPVCCHSSLKIPSNQRFDGHSEKITGRVSARTGSLHPRRVETMYSDKRRRDKVKSFRDNCGKLPENLKAVGKERLRKNLEKAVRNGKGGEKDKNCIGSNRKGTVYGLKRAKSKTNKTLKSNRTRSKTTTSSQVEYQSLKGINFKVEQNSRPIFKMKSKLKSGPRSRHISDPNARPASKPNAQRPKNPHRS